MTSFSKILFSASLLGLFLTAGCKKDAEQDPTPTPTPTTPTYTVPTTYNFSNADFSSSTKRISMLGELTTYIRITHVNVAHGTLDAQKLKDMYANVNSMFTDALLNTSGLQLKD